MKNLKKISILISILLWMYGMAWMIMTFPVVLFILFIIGILNLKNLEINTDED